MILQISSGNGPIECELAVAKLYSALCKEYPSISMIDSHASRWVKDGYTSIVFSVDDNLSTLDGTIEWICKSPLRPHHKRRNWFIDISVIKDIVPIDTQGKVRIEFFHCGGNGGQNVNKVETGVRLIHEPTGIVVKCSEERTQGMNRKRALEKLSYLLAQRKAKAQQGQKASAWRESTKLVRGNPIRIYEGLDFKLKGGTK